MKYLKKFESTTNLMGNIQELEYILKDEGLSVSYFRYGCENGGRYFEINLRFSIKNDGDYISYLKQRLNTELPGSYSINEPPNIEGITIEFFRDKVASKDYFQEYLDRITELFKNDKDRITFIKISINGYPFYIIADYGCLEIEDKRKGFGTDIFAGP